MTCVFIIAALKKEAEMYLSHGLYQEALELYDCFLDRVANLDPPLKKSLETAMVQVKNRMAAMQEDENHMLNEAAISRIKIGWRGACSHTDRLVSARALRDLGLYQEGLQEYRKLLIAKCLTVEVAEGAADCLVHLTRPHQLPRSVDAYLDGIFQFPKNMLMFKLLMAGKLDFHRHPRHFQALYTHLTRLGQVPADLRKHIQSLEERAKSIANATVDDDAYGPVDGLDYFYREWTRKALPGVGE